MKRLAIALIGVSVAGVLSAALVAQDREALRRSVIARGKSLELPTTYVPPPGEKIEHYASGYAKIMCTAVFVTGLEPAFAMENVGYFTAPYESRAQLGTPRIDRQKQTVEVTMPNGTVRLAKHVGSQGCVTVPVGKTDVSFTPSVVTPRVPDPKTTPWPMGDLLPDGPPPAGVDMAKVQAAVETAFDPAAMTAAFVVTYKGRIIAERYGPNITPTTPLESWSMGKSLSGTLLGILIQKGVYTLDQPAPIPEWQGANDPRRTIRIRDILNMSSGLRIIAPQDPDYDESGPYPDHLYYYTGSMDAFKYAATRPQQWEPGKVGRYRNTDPVLTNYLTRLAVEKRGEDYHAWPQRNLFDKLGIRTFVMDTDPFGNFLTHGYESASGRDWARIANLYLQDGVWNGERILPEGYASFVGALAPAWVADGRPQYGGLFWVNGDGAWPAPKDMYFMSGVGGQQVLIIPSHQLAVVRLGHYKGVSAAGRATRRSVGMLVEAVQPVR
ncbi:MAG: serine hydrolase domain-containing protein [Vicinamibacterales bacterium]